MPRAPCDACCCSGSHVSLHSVDLTSSPLRSRSSSLSASAQFSAGVLHLRVHGARKLEKKGMFGKADPYVLVTFGPTKAGAMFSSSRAQPSLNILMTRTQFALRSGPTR